MKNDITCREKPLSSQCQAKGLIFIPVISAQLILLAGSYRFCNNAAAGGMSAAVAARRGLAMLSMIEVSFYLIAIPMIFCLMLPVRSKNEKNIQHAAHGAKSARMLFTMTLTALLVLPSAIPALYLYARQLPANVIFTYLITLLLSALLFSAIANLINSLTTNAFASITTVYLISLSLAGCIILVNPLIKWSEDPHSIIQAAIFLNPYVAVASSIDLDILRTDPLYYLSTISAYQFRYPSPFQLWLSYGFMAFCLFVIEMVFSGKTRQTKA